MKTLKFWIEAMRLRTLPVSIAGVVMAIAFNFIHHNLNIIPAIICLLFAVLAQIASNFANEYFDYKAGRDKPGREGPRRGVTEGEITPKAMKNAIYLTLFLACCLGLSLVTWGGWWLIAVGILIAIGVFAYSAGPYPLSTHGWGEVGVVFFFGLIPVNFTYYVETLQWSTDVAMASLAVGLMGANVLIVNNYRDVEDDRAVNKRTLCVRWGRRAMLGLYFLNAVVATLCLSPLWIALGWISLPLPIIYISVSSIITRKLAQKEGAALTPFLGITSILMFAIAFIATLLAIATN